MVAEMRVLCNDIKNVTGENVSFSSDPLLDLIHHLREQSGIKPIPLSEAEKSSGAMEALSAVLSPSAGGRMAPTSSASKDFLDTIHYFRKQTGIAPVPLREAADHVTPQGPSVVVRSPTEQQQTQQKKYAIPEKPQPPPLPIEQEKPAMPFKRTYGFLAAYKKNQ